MRYPATAAALAALFCVLNLADSGITLYAISRGAREANPMMRSLLALGPFYFLAFKVFAGAALAVYLFWQDRRGTLVLGCAMFLAVVAWNVWRVGHPAQ